MKKVKLIGLFREFTLDPKDSSLKDNVSEKPQTNEERIVSYLKSGKLLVASPGVVTDVLSHSNEIIGSSHVYTDGSWAWYSNLAYYVEKYHLVLPKEFISHMAANFWRIPENTDITDIEI